MINNIFLLESNVHFHKEKLKLICIEMDTNRSNGFHVVNGFYNLNRFFYLFIQVGEYRE